MQSTTIPVIAAFTDGSGTEVRDTVAPEYKPEPYVHVRWASSSVTSNTLPLPLECSVNPVRSVNVSGYEDVSSVVGGLNVAALAEVAKLPVILCAGPEIVYVPE